MTPLSRGQIYFFDLGYGDKPFLVVSNNARNRHLKSALVARITTTSKPDRDSIVTLSHEDPLVGSVLCDDIETLYEEEELRPAGAVTLGTMMKVDKGLKVAFALR